jgi:hypothetical protein
MVLARKIRGQGPAAHPVNTPDTDTTEKGPARLHASGKPHEVESGSSRLHASTGAHPSAHRLSPVASIHALQGAGLNRTEAGPPRIERYRG